MERLYQLYFKISSLRPFGAIDWCLRKLIGKLFNDASSNADMKMIRHLSKNRIDASKQILGYREPQTTPLPKVDTFIFSQSGSLNEALADGNAPYIFLCHRGEEPSRDSLNRLLRKCQEEAHVAVWEISPTLAKRQAYIDPITLEVPYTLMNKAILRRDIIEQIGGFKNTLPLTAQALDMSYRLRASGYRLVNAGPSGIAETSLESHSVQVNGARTKNVMRKQYSRLLNRTGRQPCSPSRLWRGNYELEFGPPHDIKPLEPRICPVVSIIIRTYGDRKLWLEQSLSSLLNQSYPKLEILIVEDGGENSRADAEALQAKRQSGNRCIRYLSQKKLGKSSAGNLALSQAKGEYIGFLDDDDLLYPHHIEILYNALVANPSKLAAYGLAWEVHTRKIPGQGYWEEHYEIARHTQGAYSAEKLGKLNFLPIQSVLFHRSLFDEMGGFEPKRQYLEDWDLWRRYASRTEFTHVPMVTSLYRTVADPYQRIDRVKNQQRRTI